MTAIDLDAYRRLRELERLAQQERTEEAWRRVNEAVAQMDAATPEAEACRA